MDRDKFHAADTHDGAAPHETQAPDKSNAELVDDLVKKKKARDTQALTPTMKKSKEFSSLSVAIRPKRRARG
jgi:major membrane immunogen (membrane-anchored lipoprotein)